MKQVLAIDIGMSCVKVLAAKVTSAQIEILGSGSAPTSGYAYGKVTKVESLVASIRQAIDCVMTAASGSFDFVYVGIGLIDLQCVNALGSVAPQDPRSLIEADGGRACRASVAALSSDQAILHIVPVQYIVDDHSTASLPVGLPGRALKVRTHVITISQTLKSQLDAELARQSVPVISFVANSLASALALADQTQASKCFFILDIGAGTADVSFYREGQLVLSKSLPYGGEYITSDIMQAFSVNHKHAEGIKKYYAKLDKNLYHQDIMLDCNDYGTTDKNIAYDFLYDIIESRTEELVTLIYQEVNEFIPRDEAEQQNCKVYLTGGSSQLHSFVRLISERFQMPVKAIMPAKLDSEYLHPENTVGYGVLLFAASHLPVKAITPTCWNLMFDKIKTMFGL
jgi:cell division protein FtsA